MLKWIIMRSTVLAIMLNTVAVVSLAEALRTSVYVMDATVVLRNQFALKRARAEPLTIAGQENVLLEYKITQHEKEFITIRGEIKELRADFTHITQMLIGALVAIVINLGITLVTHRRRSSNERAET